MYVLELFGQTCRSEHASAEDNRDLIPILLVGRGGGEASRALT